MNEAVGDARVTKRRTIEALHSLFDGVHVFHACKPVDISSYYEKGLLLSNSDSIDRLASARFLGSNPTDDQLRSFEDTKAKIGKRDDGKLWVSLDHRALERHGGHFLSYGSERQYCLATNMVGDISHYKQELTRSGTPTIFHARIRWDMLSDATVERLAQRVAQNLRRVSPADEVPQTIFDMVLNQAVPPTDILDHWMPE